MAVVQSQGIVAVSGKPTDGTNLGGQLKESIKIFRHHHQNVGDALLNISGIGTVTGEPVEKDEDRPAYVHQDWPRMIYHVDGRELIVNDEKELKAATAAGFRKEPYPKVRVAVADAATEKKAQLEVNVDLEAKLRALTDELEKLKAQGAGLGR